MIALMEYSMMIIKQLVAARIGASRRCCRKTSTTESPEKIQSARSMLLSMRWISAPSGSVARVTPATESPPNRRRAST